jgi:hypothetical protein
VLPGLKCPSKGSATRFILPGFLLSVLLQASRDGDFVVLSSVPMCLGQAASAAIGAMARKDLVKSAGYGYRVTVSIGLQPLLQLPAEIAELKIVRLRGYPHIET